MYTKFEPWEWLKAVGPQDYFSIFVPHALLLSCGPAFLSLEAAWQTPWSSTSDHRVRSSNLGVATLHTWCGENSVAVLVYWTHQRKNGKTDIAATWCFWEIQHQWHSIKTSKKLVQVHYRMTIPLDRSWSYDVWAWPSSVSNRQIANEVVDSRHSAVGYPPG